LKKGRKAMAFYERGQVGINYEEVGSGFPLLVIPGGGLNSTIAGLVTHPFNPFDEFKQEFRVIAADLRNAKGGQSPGPLEVDRPWDADDHVGLMDHLGIREFMVLGFCIGGPFIWNLLKRAGDRVVAAVPAQPSGYRPEMPGLSYNNNMKGWGPELCARRPDVTMAMIDTFLTNMYGGARADFVYTVTREFVRSCRTPDLGVARRRSGAPVCGGDGDRAPRAQRAGEPLPVERYPEQDSLGRAPYPHLSPCLSACCAAAIYGGRRPVAPDTSFPHRARAQHAQHDRPRRSRRATAVNGAPGLAIKGAMGSETRIAGWITVGVK
jgi:pimeloyl-ACP methyl ester carboxylesterase